jgi:hypothetical protein
MAVLNVVFNPSSSVPNKVERQQLREENVESEVNNRKWSGIEKAAGSAYPIDRKRSPVYPVRSPKTACCRNRKQNAGAQQSF